MGRFWRLLCWLVQKLTRRRKRQRRPYGKRLRADRRVRAIWKRPLKDLLRRARKRAAGKPDQTFRIARVAVSVR